MSNWLTALLVGGIVGMFVSPFILMFAWLPMRRKAVSEEVTPQERMAILRNTVIAVVVVVLLVAAGFMVLKKTAPDVGTSTTGSFMDGGLPGGSSGMMGGGTSSGGVAILPAKMAGLPLTDRLTGTQALQRISAMHTSQIPVTDAVVGSYGSGGQKVEVWAAYTSAGQMATAMAQQMASAIGGGNTSFSAPQQMMGGVWKTQGMGQVHYFFASGNAVWWVSADTAVAENALAQTQALAKG